MRPTLLLLALGATLASAALAQAPEAAAPASLTEKANSALPAMAIKVRKTASATTAPDTYKGRVLTVGSGGGFTGKETAYLLLDDGRLYGRTATAQPTYTLIGKQTAATTKQVFTSVEGRCAIRKTTYDKPGNRYRFVRWKKGAEQHKVAWAPEDRNVPAGYDQVYSRFMAMLPASTN